MLGMGRFSDRWVKSTYSDTAHHWYRRAHTTPFPLNVRMQTFYTEETAKIMIRKSLEINVQIIMN
jgi:hypothetical protein